MHFDNFPGERESLIREAVRLRWLAADLIETADGRGPTDADMADSPNPRPLPRSNGGVQCLMGIDCVEKAGFAPESG